MKNLEEVVVVIDMRQDPNAIPFGFLNELDLGSLAEQQMRSLVQDNLGCRYPRFRVLENNGKRVSVFSEPVAGAWDDVWVRTLNSRQYFARALENSIR